MNHEPRHTHGRWTSRKLRDGCGKLVFVGKRSSRLSRDTLALFRETEGNVAPDPSFSVPCMAESKKTEPVGTESAPTTWVTAARGLGPVGQGCQDRCFMFGA